MMLGLVKNGDEGTLHVIDLPPLCNPKDLAWTVKGKVYGVVIPEGKIRVAGSRCLPGPIRGVEC